MAKYAGVLYQIKAKLSGSRYDGNKLFIEDSLEEIQRLNDVSCYMNMLYRNLEIKYSGEVKGVRKLDVSVSEGWSGRWADRVKFSFIDESRQYQNTDISHGFEFCKYWDLEHFVNDLHNDMIYIYNLDFAIAFFFSYRINFMYSLLKEQTKKINDTYNFIVDVIDNPELNDYDKKLIHSKTYIMKDYTTGLYKIGKSKNPEYRERTLQSEKPTIKMIKVFDSDIESDLHKEFADVRVRGEWFKLNIVQLKRICTHYE
jgi:hypothetical protein